MRTSRLTIFLLFALILYGGLLYAAQEKEAAPVIEVDELTYNFKRVPQGEVVKHDFKVFNKGNAPLTIKNVKPG